jgi:hypothetical protein
MKSTAPRRNLVAAEADFGRYAGLGLQFAVTLALFGALGWWLDSKLGTTPWLLVAGILLGAVAAFVALLRAVPGARIRSHASAAPDTATVDDAPSAPRSETGTRAAPDARSSPAADSAPKLPPPPRRPGP